MWTTAWVGAFSWGRGMPLLACTVDFSDRDFDSPRLRLHKFVRSVFPDWTDFNAANFSNLVLGLIKGVLWKHIVVDDDLLTSLPECLGNDLAAVAWRW